MTVTKKELAAAVMVGANITVLDSAMKAAESVLNAIADALANGHRVELRNFGVFEIKTRKAKIGQNVYAGTQVKIPRRKVVKFRMGKDLENRVA